MPTRKGGHYHIARPDGSGLSQGVDDQGEAESADSNTDLIAPPAKRAKESDEAPLTTVEPVPPSGPVDAAAPDPRGHLSADDGTPPADSNSTALVVAEQLLPISAPLEQAEAEASSSDDDEGWKYDENFMLPSMPKTAPPSMHGTSVADLPQEVVENMGIKLSKSQTSAIKSFEENMNYTVGCSIVLQSNGWKYKCIWLVKESFINESDVPPEAMTHSDRCDFLCVLFNKIMRADDHSEHPNTNTYVGYLDTFLKWMNVMNRRYVNTFRIPSSVYRMFHMHRAAEGYANLLSVVERRLEVLVKIHGKGQEPNTGEGLNQIEVAKMLATDAMNFESPKGFMSILIWKMITTLRLTRGGGSTLRTWTIGRFRLFIKHIAKHNRNLLAVEVLYKGVEDKTHKVTLAKPTGFGRPNVEVYDTEPDNWWYEGDPVPTTLKGDSLPVLLLLRRDLASPVNPAKEADPTKQPLFLQPMSAFRTEAKLEEHARRYGGMSVLDYCRFGLSKDRADFKVVDGKPTLAIKTYMFNGSCGANSPMGCHSLNSVVRDAAREAGIPKQIKQHGTATRTMANALKAADAGEADYVDSGWASSKACTTQYTTHDDDAALRLQATMTGASSLLSLRTDAPPLAEPASSALAAVSGAHASAATMPAPSPAPSTAAFPGFHISNCPGMTLHVTMPAAPASAPLPTAPPHSSILAAHPEAPERWGAPDAHVPPRERVPDVTASWFRPPTPAPAAAALPAAPPAAATAPAAAPAAQLALPPAQPAMPVMPAGGPDRAYAEEMQAWTERYLANAARE